MAGETIRVCIGTEPKTYVAQKVLESSIQRRTDAKVEFTPLIGRRWEYPADLTVGTGFSLRRWMIAEYFGWQGMALYLDADQIVLDDIARLWQLGRPEHGADAPVVYCTYQPDKFYPEPAPQTSVMLIDCARAREHWGFDIRKVIAHLRANPTKDAYARFMHAEWIPRERIARLPIQWNHLNVYGDGSPPSPVAVRGGCAAAEKTALLHYTKEPEQPWYKPNHPLAHLWRIELLAALRHGLVTEQDVLAAVAKWGTREDWRATNGIHPDYAKLVAVGVRGNRKDRAGHVRNETKPSAPRAEQSKPKAAPAPAVPETPAVKPGEGTLRVLWVTSCAADMYEASGRQLVSSFRETDATGTLLLCPEGFTVPDSPDVRCVPLDGDTYLRDWLRQNADIIPRHLGGNHDGACRCKGGPYALHDKRHRQPCVAHWFNRNASRWFRKVVALRQATRIARQENYQAIVWLDSDCAFRTKVSTRVVESWFRVSDKAKAHLVFSPNVRGGVGVGCFYLKATRPVLESGCVGFLLAAGGDKVLNRVFRQYEGSFRHDGRWDDSYQIQKAIEDAKRGDKVEAIDLAFGVSKEHADVFPHSALAGFIAHDKGKHSRKLGIMT